MSDPFELFHDAVADRYAVEREIGPGGMAHVFVARDLKHRRPVAIKVLSTELGAAIGADRFLREIEIAAKLTHPHILPLYDSGEAAGLLYYVMPFVEGSRFVRGSNARNSSRSTRRSRSRERSEMRWHMRTVATSSIGM